MAKNRGSSTLNATQLNEAIKLGMAKNRGSSTLCRAQAAGI